ncbi:hypothetical protein SAMN05216490_1135 [Mucilaginibacter mallensis]|uniref:Uncharacterized protein n=1 Tax=Mucilaginibacter mallensis TaxID=652787 RepID=A0A1H1S4W3_MUCMA|nr:hypothetical protein [Mucilaginibacter mallensis]SDS42818.1 hypothetical protein SAMN05216490_1135 [Mucilaginibacter mallensis]
MKKILIILSLILFTSFSYSQTFKQVKIDSLVSVALPPTYITKDTLNQRIFSANASFGYIVVIREPNSKTIAPLKKEKDLNNVFKDYANGIVKLSGGTVQNKRDTTVGTLKGLRFDLRTDNGDGSVQYRRFLLLYTHDVTYTFEYYYDEMRAALTKDEAKTYFSSIKLAPDLQRNDQYQIASVSPDFFGVSQIMIYAGITIIIVVSISMVVKRKKRNDDEHIAD